MSNETTPEVIVVGGGISGLAFAWKAAGAGRQVLLLERSARVGGCIHSERGADDHWYELGAHTTYNSYGGFLDLAVASGAAEKIIERGPARKHFGLLRDGAYQWLTPPKVLITLSWLEAAIHFPIGIFRSKAGQTMASHFSRLIGAKNFSRILSPFLAAVPSQSADGFPAEGPGSLFKKRPRRKEFVRSFGFTGGLQTVCDAVATLPGITVERGVGVERVGRAGDSYVVTTDDGRTLEAPVVAIATPIDVADQLLADSHAELSAAIRRVATVTVDSVGVVLPREECWMPDCAFVVPVDDAFHSAVTRDPFPDATRRAFAFHFRPGHSRDQRLDRMAEVLRVDREVLGEPAEKHLTLPAPALGHEALASEIDRHLAGNRLALVGNYFDGLAIEDCVQRGFSEAARVLDSPGSTA